MRNLTPCPSPRNTNLERLYLVRMPHRTPTMALDQEMAPPDISNGNGDVGAPDAYAALCQFLQENLSPDVYAEGEAMLTHLIEELHAVDDGGTNNPAMATDAMIRRSVAQSAKARARLGVERRAELLKRFPGLANARVV
jgi:hypothetical protein